jgi:hypothetical protein
MRLKSELFIPQLQSFEVDGADYIPWKSELQSLSEAGKTMISGSRPRREFLALNSQATKRNAAAHAALAR